DCASLMYAVAELAVLSLAKIAAVSDTAEASAALAAVACDGMAVPRSCPANVLSVPATLRSTPSTQVSLSLHACTPVESLLSASRTGAVPAATLRAGG